MLDSIFMQVLDMSKTASIVILVVLLARLLLMMILSFFLYSKENFRALKDSPCT